MFRLQIPHRIFDIKKIVDSGQIFNYVKLSDTKYIFIYKNYHTMVESVEDGYFFHCSEKEFKTIWTIYFDLERDYESAFIQIIHTEPRIETMINSFLGIRILKQDPFEMLITFIVSQSKSIPQIRKLICTLAVNFGNKLGEFYDVSTEKNIEIYQFPTADQLQFLTEEDFRNMKFGYRAPYLVDAIRYQNEIGLDYISDIENKKLLSSLKSIKGVGNKVAACVMLFGFGRMDVFPVDTWMRKIMLDLYAEEFESMVQKQITKSRDQHDEHDKQDKHDKHVLDAITISNEKLEEFGQKKFGNYAGLAQQFLFEYSRQVKDKNS